MAVRTVRRDIGRVTVLDLTGKLAGDAADTFATDVDRLIIAGRTRLILNLAGVLVHRQRRTRRPPVEARRGGERGRPAQADQPDCAGP